MQMQTMKEQMSQTEAKGTSQHPKQFVNQANHCVSTMDSCIALRCLQGHRKPQGHASHRGTAHLQLSGSLPKPASETFTVSSCITDG